LTFAVLVVGLCLLQMDQRLSVQRLVLGYSSAALLLAVFVVTHARQRTTWPFVLLVAPLMVTVAENMRVKPAIVALALAIIAGQSLYGSRSMAVVRTILVAGALPGLMLVGWWFDKTAQSDLAGLFVVPLPLLAMFAVMLRTLYSALEGQQRASEREAFLARTSRGLLGITDLTQARAVIAAAADELCAMTAGLGLLLIQSDAQRATVIAAPGLPGTLVGLRAALGRVAPFATATDLAGAGATRLEAVDLLISQVAGKNRQVVGMRLGTGTDRVLLVTSVGPLAQEVRDVLHTITAELALVEVNCRSHAELVRLAHHDALTTILNRGAFFEQLTLAIDEAAGADGRVTLLLIDLDLFKTVNDTMGHAAGDQVLIHTARRIREFAGPGGVAARFGGDEFALLLTDIKDPAHAHRLAEALRDRLLEPIPWKTTNIRIGASIGVMTTQTGMTADDALRCADIAMYSAKAQGKNRVVRFPDDQPGSIAESRQPGEPMPWS
jgi:diguanylate cyclase (GGDEF)-like protein